MWDTMYIFGNIYFIAACAREQLWCTINRLHDCVHLTAPIGGAQLLISITLPSVLKNKHQHEREHTKHTVSTAFLLTRIKHEQLGGPDGF